MSSKHENRIIFTKEMKKSHTILIPNMLPIHFKILKNIMNNHGYKVELLTNDGPQIAQIGLKYVHNDTCHPALLVIGQMIEALQSGKYDLNKTALMITQTGGGCRASNYIALLRKALKKAGFENIPVISLNVAGLESNPGFKISLKMLREMIAAVFYGDELMMLRNQTAPYERVNGASDKLTSYFTDYLSKQFSAGHGYTMKSLRKNFELIASEFSKLKLNRTEKTKVGIVGEIYVKFAPLGNNHLQEFLEKENCEVNIPGLMGFMQYCIVNMGETVKLYGGTKIKRWLSDFAISYIDKIESAMYGYVTKYGFHAPLPFTKVKELAGKVIGYGVKMGEGWLLPGEMMELIASGCKNIVCTQPFGCLPNHIVAKGVINTIKKMYPDANIVSVDYDSSSSHVNQENRIKLMLSAANKRNEKTEQPNITHDTGVEERYSKMLA